MKTASERMQERLRKDQPLIRAYIGQGLRKDQARLENSQFQALAESLRRHGINDQVISAAIADAQLKTA